MRMSATQNIKIESEIKKFRLWTKKFKRVNCICNSIQGEENKVDIECYKLYFDTLGYCLSIKEDKIIMILRVLQGIVEEKLVTFDLLLKKHFLIWRNKYLTNYVLTLYRYIFQIQYKRLEELTRIQLSNTKESRNLLFAGKTPYFNYVEFIRKLSNVGIEIKSLITRCIEQKAKAYNQEVCADIECQMQLLRSQCHISISKSEFSILKNDVFNKNFSKLPKSNSSQKSKFIKSRSSNRDSLINVSTSDYHLYIEDKEKIFKLIIPDFGDVIVNACQEDIQTINYIIYVKDRSVYSSIKPSIQDRKKKRQSKLSIISEFHNQLEENFLTRPNQMDEIQRAMIKFNFEFSKSVSITSEFLAKFFQSTIKKELGKKSDKKINYKIISNYSWMNVSKVLGDFNQIQKLERKPSFIKNMPFYIEKCERNEDKFAIIAESIFGSYSRWWDTDGLNEEETNRSKNKIKKRHEMIQYIISNLHFEFQDTKKYCRDLLSFLISDTQNINVDKYGNPFIGCYNGMVVDPLLVKQLPFEISISINSTVSRLEILSKWNELTSCPQFIRQISFSHIFGFKVSSLKSFYQDVCYAVEIGGSCFQENKLHLIDYVKDKIESKIEKLKPYLILRHQGEINLKQKQENGFECTTQLNENENNEYKIILLYMYLMCCLKCVNFNPDYALRTKLVCVNHQHKYQKCKYIDVCPCLYSIDEETLQSLMKKEVSRNDFIDIEKRKWLVEENKSSNFSIKEERKEELYTYLKKLPFNENLLENIGNGWKIEIKQDLNN